MDKRFGITKHAFYRWIKASDCGKMLSCGGCSSPSKDKPFCAVAKDFISKFSITTLAN